MNGNDVTDGAAKLRKGRNCLVAVFCSTLGRPGGRKYSTENAGWYLRLEDPKTKQRVTNVRFEAPTTSKE